MNNGYSFIHVCFCKILSLFNEKTRVKLLKTLEAIENDIVRLPGSYVNDIYNNMSMENLLPRPKNIFFDGEMTHEELMLSNKKVINSDKIRIRIKCDHATGWNTFGSFYQELIKDEKYDVILLCENNKRNVEYLRAHNCRFICIQNYDIRKDRPDILFLNYYSSANKEIDFESVRKYVKVVLTFLIPVVINEKNEGIHWDHVLRAHSNLKPDYYIMDVYPYTHLKGYISSDKALCMGHPKYDGIYNEINNYKTSGKYSKLENKAVFLYCSDHGVSKYSPNNNTSVDVVFKFILSYFIRHEEFGLIVRFHPQLIMEICNGDSYWNLGDVERLKSYIEESKNIVWDDDISYGEAYGVSDALLVDANCGIIVTYLTTEKPICRMLRNRGQHLINHELKDAYSYASNEKELDAFINNVVHGKDKKAANRKKAFQKTCLHFDGINGKRLKDKIDEIWENMC